MIREEVFFSFRSKDVLNLLLLGHGAFYYNMHILPNMPMYIKYISGISGIFQINFKHSPELLYRIVSERGQDETAD